MLSAARYSKRRALWAAGLVLLIAYVSHGVLTAWICPRCLSIRVVQIVYGKPKEGIGRGRPHIATVEELGYLQGGCVVEPYDRYCKSCGLMWSRWRPWDREQGPE